MGNPSQAPMEHHQHDGPPHMTVEQPQPTSYPQPPPSAAHQQQQPMQFPPPQRSPPPPPTPEEFSLESIKQSNHGYPHASSQPVPFPPQGQQTMLNQPGSFIPQGQQPMPGQLMQFPHASPHNNPMYQNGSNQHMYFAHENPQQTNHAQPGVQFQPYNTSNMGTGPSSVAGVPIGGSGPSPQPIKRNAWNSDLFDCMNDPTNALITACFPCVTFGQIAEIVDEGHTSCATSGLFYGVIAFCIGLPCIMSCTYRTKLRNKFGLPETPAPDWMTHFLCEWCAICQEYRELQARGWDPAIGYQGNLARSRNLQAASTMMAPVGQRMMA